MKYVSLDELNATFRNHPTVRNSEVKTNYKGVLVKFSYNLWCQKTEPQRHNLIVRQENLRQGTGTKYRVDICSQSHHLHPQSNPTAISFDTPAHTHTPTHTHTHSQMHTVVFPPLHHVTVFLNSENYKRQYISHLNCNLNWLNYHPPGYSSSVLMIFKYKLTLHLNEVSPITAWFYRV